MLSLLTGVMFSINALKWDSLDHVELFSGKAAVTTAELEAGVTGLPRFRRRSKGELTANLSGKSESESLTT